MAQNHTLSLRLSRKEFVYRTGVRFRGMTISQTEKGFNVILRGLQSSGAAVYAMAQHECPVTGLEILTTALMGRQGATMWHKDKFYKG